MGVPAGGSLTADQWLIAATAVCPVAVSSDTVNIWFNLIISVQVPQIWDEYSSGDPEQIRLRRLRDFQSLAERKKAAQAEARKAREAEKAAAAQSARRSGRKRTRTTRAQVRLRHVPCGVHA
jgi:hypothetical protein